MNYMKSFHKILFAAATLFTATIVCQAEQFTAVLATGTPTLLSTNRASVYQVEATSTGGGLIQLFDSDNTAAPYYGTNYVNAAYATRITYPTNYVTSFIGYNGFTNWYTNLGIWTIT